MFWGCRFLRDVKTVQPDQTKEIQDGRLVRPAWTRGGSLDSKMGKSETVVSRSSETTTTPGSSCVQSRRSAGRGEAESVITSLMLGAETQSELTDNVPQRSNS